MNSPPCRVRPETSGHTGGACQRAIPSSPPFSGATTSLTNFRTLGANYVRFAVTVTSCSVSEDAGLRGDADCSVAADASPNTRTASADDRINTLCAFDIGVALRRPKRSQISPSSLRQQCDGGLAFLHAAHVGSASAVGRRHALACYIAALRSPASACDSDKDGGSVFGSERPLAEVHAIEMLARNRSFQKRQRRFAPPVRPVDGGICLAYASPSLSRRPRP